MKLTKEITDEQLQKLVSSKDSQLKASLDLNWLQMQRSIYADIPMERFIDWLHKSLLTGADPRTNEIYLIPFNKCVKEHGKPDKWVKDASVIFSYDFFRKRAFRSGNYDGCEITLSRDPIDKDMVATCKIYRKDCSHPFVYEAYLGESGKKKNGELAGNWKQMPKLMLKKTAEAGALRMAFPEDFAGMYIPEEMEKLGDDVSRETKLPETTAPKALPSPQPAPIEVPKTNPESSKELVERTFGDPKEPPENVLEDIPNPFMPKIEVLHGEFTSRLADLGKSFDTKAQIYFCNFLEKDLDDWEEADYPKLMEHMAHWVPAKDKKSA